MEFWPPPAPTVRVRWYFVRDPSRVLPFSTCFGSRNWHPDNQEGWSGPGEVYGASRPWRNGIHPGLIPANHLCVTPEQALGEEPGPPAVRPPSLLTGGIACCQLLGVGGGAGGGPDVGVDTDVARGGGAGGGEAREIDPTAGAIVWLESTGLDPVGDGNEIDVWPDRSAAGRDWSGTAGTGPYASLDPGGGSRLVSLWGIGNLLLRAGATQSIGAFDAWLAVYFDESVPWDGGVQIGRDVAPGSGWIVAYDDVDAYARVTTTTRAANLADVGTGWHVVRAVRSGSALALLEDGAVLDTPAFSGTGISLTSMHGAVLSAGGSTAGVVGEVLVFGQQLTDELAGAVLSFFRSKWGTP